MPIIQPLKEDKNLICCDIKIVYFKEKIVFIYANEAWFYQTGKDTMVMKNLTTS